MDEVHVRSLLPADAVNYIELLHGIDRESRFLLWEPGERTLEPRIKAIVSSCGFCTFQKDDVPSWTGPVYMPRIASLFANDADQVPFDFSEIVATFAPRPFFASAAQRDSDFDVSGVKSIAFMTE